MSAEEEEARRIAEMGKPILGEHSRLEVVIEESYEFKVNHSFIDFPGADANLWVHSCQQCSRLKLRMGVLLKEAAFKALLFSICFRKKPKNETINITLKCLFEGSSMISD